MSYSGLAVEPAVEVAPASGDSHTTSLERRLKFWNAQLLDVSKRNRLLYFNPAVGPLARSPHGIRCEEPDCDTIWNRLARLGKTQHFFELPSEIEQALNKTNSPNAPNLQATPADDENGWVGPLLTEERPLKNDQLRTSPAGMRLGRALSNLRTRAKTSLDEAGIVTLYLAFGFLRWTEEDHPQDGPTEVYAPLLLLPVELTRNSPRDAYRLLRQDDEVLLNPALRYKLEDEFKIVLPDAPALEEKSLHSYWHEVQSALNLSPVATRNHWCVLDWVYLGVFSFHKIAMFRDLHEHRPRLEKHPLVRALAGDHTTPVNRSISLPSGAELDALSPAEMELVIDADSSQHEAIIAARRGLSFVLQGPPGTGKSQTITNIIAECLENDKTVLFVSEKMAALDVVHRRLKAVGLGDFCLEAHSHKANKRAVVAELDRTLRLPRLAPHAPTIEDEELEKLRDHLNGYVAALHQVHPVARLSPYDAMGHFAALDEAPTFQFEFRHPTQLSPTHRTNLKQWFQELDQLDHVWRHETRHPWRGVRLTDTGLQTRTALRAHLQAAALQLARMDADWNSLCRAWGIEVAPSLHELNRVLELSSFVEAVENVPRTQIAHWLHENRLESLHQLAREGRTRWETYQSRRADFESKWQASLHRLESDRLQQHTQAASSWLERLGGTDAALEKRSALETHFAAIEHLKAALHISTSLANTLSVEAPGTLQGIAQLHALAGLVRKQRQPLRSWFAPGALAELRREADAARLDGIGRRELEAQLEAHWNLDALLALPCDELAARFESKYGGFFARWGGDFKADRKRLQNALRPGESFDFDRVLPDLKRACELKTRRQDAESKSQERARLFGSHWRGDSTDWESLNSALSEAHALSQHWQDTVPEGILRVVSAPGGSPNGAHELVNEQDDELETALTRLQTELKGLFALFINRKLPFTELPFTYAPLTELCNWLATGRQQLTTFFAAIDEIDACAAPRFVPPTYSARSEALETSAFLHREKADLIRASSRFEAAFGDLYTGASTAWDVIERTLEGAQKLSQWFGGLVPSAFLAVFNDATRRTEARQLTQQWQTQAKELQEHLTAIQNQFERPVVGDRVLEAVEFRVLAQDFAAKVERFHELDEWLAYQGLQKRACELGLSLAPSGHGFWEELQRYSQSGKHPAREAIALAFWKCFWMRWLDEACAESPVLRTFTGDAHDIAIARFSRLDGSGQERARERLRAKLSAKKPVLNLETPRTGQLGILQREAVKKTRHLPLRTLFEQTAEVVQALKPCMLMSPLSVAQFLPPEAVKFDLVIFDEASQITPEDAIGAIARGTQLIVVGDNQQMPPSSFFDATGSDSEDAGEESARIESILDECLGAGWPQKKLLWHYRSRFEELIAFSNRHFYGGELLTFPGPVAPGGGSATAALSWEQVEGFYSPSGHRTGDGALDDDGGKDEAQTNRIEARHVAALAVEHARTSPHLSLGIITFNEAQRRAIEAEIYRQTADSPALDEFFWTPREEGFFIKALENVQGDERDVIFFSVGFGPRRARDGSIQPVLMNFGPLSRKGGERRLNVAITRARTRVHIVTSFAPEHLDLSRAKSEGARLLRGYIEWARDHSRPTSDTQHQKSAPSSASAGVADSLARTLHSAGWKTHQNIGLGGFRVDVGIENPNEPGNLLLGVVCDGDSYAHCATARDRDRLRPQMLERLGWQLHRLWSPDWVRNSNTEIQNVLESARRAHETTQNPFHVRGQMASDFAVSLATDSPETSLSPLPEGQPLELQSSGVEFAPDAHFSSPLAELNPFITPVIHSEGAISTEDSEIPFEPTTLEHRGDAQSFYTHLATDPEPILAALLEVIRIEGPVHALIAGRRVVAAWEMTRAGAKAQEAVAQVAAQGAKRGLFQIRQEEGTRTLWYWPQHMERPTPRGPSLTGTRREADEIALEEIAEAALRIVERGYGFSHDDLVRLTARFFGWKQNGQRVQSRIEAALKLLSQDARLTVREGHYAVRG